MKLSPLKIGQVIITPKMTLSLIGAILVLGMGTIAMIYLLRTGKFS